MNKKQNSINVLIGAKLKEARENAGLSLREVENVIGKNYSTIHSYETGRNGINVDVMEMLCDAYGVNYLEILTEIHYMRKFSK